MTATQVSNGVRSDGWRWASAERPYIYEINTWPWLNQLSVEIGRSVDLSTVPDERWAALADAGFDAVWLMGVWTRSPAGSAIALDNKELVESFQAVLPDYRPRGRRRVAVLRPRLRGRPAPGRTRRPGARPRRAGPARTGPHPRLRPQPCRTRPSVDAHEPGALRPGHQPRARGRSGILRRDRRLGAGQGSGPVLPGVAGRRAAQRVCPRSAHDRHRHTPRHRRTVRRGALRHGDADDERRLLPHLGGSGRRPTRGGLLAHRHSRRARRASWFPLHRRSLLGPRVGAATAGLRLLLRQAPLRPPRGGRGSADPAPLVRGPAVSAEAGPIHREPRRAAGCRGVRRASATGRGGGEL